MSKNNCQRLIDDEKYLEICNFLDKYCKKMLEAYISKNEIHAQEIAIGYAALQALLKKGQNPNYNSVGIPAAYSFLYLPRRVFAMIGILEQLYSEQMIRPQTVLDIGSGSDAASIALGIYFSIVKEPHEINVTALEPSPKMLEMARFKPNHCLKHISINHQQESIEKIVEIYRKNGNLREIFKDKFDLVIISASFPYGEKESDWWEDLFDTVRLLSEQRTGTVIIIEPKEKFKNIFRDQDRPEDNEDEIQDSIMKFAQYCEKSSWSIGISALSKMLPAVNVKNHDSRIMKMAKIRYLPELSDLKEQYISPSKELLGKRLKGVENPVATWNSNPEYDEIIWILSKRKSNLRKLSPNIFCIW